MTKYIGPKTDGANVATQSDVGGSSLSDATPDALTPDQAGAAGTVNSAARADHAHEILCAAAGAILPDDVAAEGTASSFARSDHTHSIATAAPGTITPDAAAAEGSSTSFARADHTHAITAAAPATNLTASTTNAEGNATSFARSDHSHAIDTAAPSSNLSATTTNAVGTSANLARSDHSHAISTGTPGAIQPDDSASAGSSANLARADHRHSIAAAAASSITGTNAEGTSTSFARADHNHAFGSKSVPASALALGPTYETSLPGSPVDGQEVYYQASGDMTTQGIVWHLRYRSAARSNAGAWEFVGGAPLHAGPSGSASSTSSSTTGAELTSGPSLTLPATGTYRVSWGAEIQSTVNPQAADCDIILYNGTTRVSSVYVVLTAQYDRDRGDKTIQVSANSGIVYTVRFANNQARSLACSDGTLTITPAFLNP